jgi:hypothetical protein
MDKCLAVLYVGQRAGGVARSHADNRASLEDILRDLSADRACWCDDDDDAGFLPAGLNPAFFHELHDQNSVGPTDPAANLWGIYL